MSRYSRLVVLAVLATAPGLVAAQAIHKCLVDGRAVYQDRPCADGEEVTTRPTQPVDQLQATPGSTLPVKSDEALREMSLKELGMFNLFLAKLLHARIGGGETTRQMDRVGDEIRRRCPGGSLINAKTVMCSK